MCFLDHESDRDNSCIVTDNIAWIELIQHPTPVSQCRTHIFSFFMVCTESRFAFPIFAFNSARYFLLVSYRFNEYDALLQHFCLPSIWNGKEIQRLRSLLYANHI